MGSSILRVVGVFLKVDVIAPVPVPVAEFGIGAAGPAISSILRTGLAVCLIGEVVELAGARVCAILPSRMFMTSRRSSSSADSRDMLMLRRPVVLVTCTSAQSRRKGLKLACWPATLYDVTGDQNWVSGGHQKPLPVWILL